MPLTAVSLTDDYDTTCLRYVPSAWSPGSPLLPDDQSDDGQLNWSNYLLGYSNPQMQPGSAWIVPYGVEFEAKAGPGCDPTVNTLSVVATDEYGGQATDTDDEEVRIVPAEVEWSKWVNGEIWYPGITLTSEVSDTIQVIDVITASQRFMLSEQWTPEHLHLIDHSISPPGSMVVSGSGWLQWFVEPQEPTTYTMAKLFHVEPCRWQSTDLFETLWVRDQLFDSKPVTIDKTPPILWIGSTYASEVYPGQQAQFLLDYGNHGGYENAVTVRAEFPPTAPFHSASPPSDSTGPAGAWAEWEVGDLSNGSAGQIGVTVDISSSTVPSDTIVIQGMILDHVDNIADLMMIFLHVSDECPPPVASFYWDPVPACVGQTVYFWDTSTNQPTSWDWGFGGLGTSTAQHSSFTFNSANDYYVQLLASNSCGSDLAMHQVPVIDCSSVPDDVDIYVKDSPADDGSVPSSSPWWISPDIWVRHVNDGGTQHQNPLPGSTNTTYIRVRNRMMIAEDNVTVGLYYAPCAPNLTWPASWSPIGSASIPSIPGGGEEVTSLPWNTPAMFGDVCLLARASSPNDPVAWGPDTVSPPSMVQNNNNIAQKSTQIEGPDPTPTPTPTATATPRVTPGPTPTPTATRPSPSGYQVYLPLVTRAYERASLH